MTSNEILYIIFVAIVGFIVFAIGLKANVKEGLTLKNIGILIVGLSVMVLSLIDGYNDYQDKKDYKTNTESLLKSLSDISLKLDRDSVILSHLDSIGISWDSKNNKPIVTKSFIQYVNNNYSELKKPDTVYTAEIHNQRYLNKKDLDSLNTIPKDYTITITYSQDLESANFTKEVEKKIIKLGYKITEISPSMLAGSVTNDHFMLYKNKGNKTAYISIPPLDNFTN
ncbi:MAG: hypothetical protein V4556_05990 [Bacteroidota bacterium]